MGSVPIGSRSPEAALLIKKATQKAGTPPFSVAVGVAVSRSAVVRNRTKRRLRSVFRQKKDALPFPIIVIARRPIITLSFKELEGACERAFAALKK
jgi:ribonuclease P protein component